ncbi:hypothetical protein RSOLAG1IB_06598 [Rhizoctonia solani AG-1 IB]|uniref:F-box domain-containing protein n=1 Tax=Thanatephorus cucumeris (strain AG1-IB / isolate 7/3/14) TaxID=1108050 RepID=A0A0B7FC51_THACB|nr:hypothetical protein RSOLAG1IB_06598 [Rhizoctonia solani AG-1 IB]
MSDSAIDNKPGVPHQTVESRKLRNSLQPVGRLPEDLLVEVLMTVKSSSSTEHPYVHHVYTASQVCSRWRRICINSPLLWACIRIETFPLSPFVDLCITRAKGAPISLNVDPLRKKHKLTTNNWRHLVRSLATRSVSTERWKALAIHVDSFEVFPDLLEHLVLHPTPNLESISCATQTHKHLSELHPAHRSNTVSFSPSKSQLLSSSLPRLSSVELKRVHLAHLFDLKPPVLLNRLTRLHLVQSGVIHYTPDAFALLLSSYPNLQEVSLTEYPYSKDTDPALWSTIPPIAFRTLCRLKLLVADVYAVDGIGTPWILRFLQSIDAPRLQQLIIVSPPMLSNSPIEELVDFISAGYTPNQLNANETNPARKSLYPMLRYLSVRFNLPKDTRLHKAESMLAALPSLKYLSILGEDVTVVGNTPQCSPCLTHLFIQSPAGPGQLKRVLHNRQEAGLPIRVLGVQENTDVTELPCTVELKRYSPARAISFLDF